MPRQWHVPNVRRIRDCLRGRKRIGAPLEARENVWGAPYFKVCECLARPSSKAGRLQRPQCRADHRSHLDIERIDSHSYDMNALIRALGVLLRIPLAAVGFTLGSALFILAVVCVFVYCYLGIIFWLFAVAWTLLENAIRDRPEDFYTSWQQLTKQWVEPQRNLGNVLKMYIDLLHWVVKPQGSTQL